MQQWEAWNSQMSQIFIPWGVGRRTSMENSPSWPAWPQTTWGCLEMNKLWCRLSFLSTCSGQRKQKKRCKENIPVWIEAPRRSWQRFHSHSPLPWGGAGLTQPHIYGFWWMLNVQTPAVEPLEITPSFRWRLQCPLCLLVFNSYFLILVLMCRRRGKRWHFGQNAPNKTKQRQRTHSKLVVWIFLSFPDRSGVGELLHLVGSVVAGKKQNKKVNFPPLPSNVQGFPHSLGGGIYTIHTFHPVPKLVGKTPRKCWGKRKINYFKICSGTGLSL